MCQRPLQNSLCLFSSHHGAHPHETRRTIQCRVARDVLDCLAAQSSLYAAGGTLIRCMRVRVQAQERLLQHAGFSQMRSSKHSSS